MEFDLSSENVNDWLNSTENVPDTLILSFDEIVEHVYEIDSHEQQEPKREPEICIPIEQKPISSKAAITCIDELILFANAINISIDLSALTDLKEKA